MRFKKMLIIACGLIIFGIYGADASVSCLAADDTTETSSEEETVYELDKEVKAWLDAGNSIPSEAKYASYSRYTHLWVIDDTDFSDGKIQLSGNNEILIVAGTDLRNWLKTQRFYGEGFGKDRVKFVRPGKGAEF